MDGILVAMWVVTTLILIVVTNDVSVCLLVPMTACYMLAIIVGIVKFVGLDKYLKYVKIQMIFG